MEVVPLYQKICWRRGVVFLLTTGTCLPSPTTDRSLFRSRDQGTERPKLTNLIRDMDRGTIENNYT